METSAWSSFELAQMSEHLTPIFWKLTVIWAQKYKSRSLIL